MTSKRTGAFIEALAFLWLATTLLLSHPTEAISAYSIRNKTREESASQRAISPRNISPRTLSTNAIYKYSFGTQELADGYEPAAIASSVGEFYYYNYLGNAFAPLVFTSHLWVKSDSLFFTLALDDPTPRLYDVTLGWAEYYAVNCATGKRVFSVAVGSQIENDIDVFQRAGCQVPYRFTFKNVQATGSLDVALFKSSENPFLSLIEIRPSENPKISFGGPSFPDGYMPARDDGIVANYFNYSDVVAGAPISGTSDDLAYASHIYTFDASLDYVLTLTAGQRYDITLGWAEIYVPNCVDGKRIFQASVNQRPPVDIDVHALAGGCRTAYQTTFYDVPADPDNGTIVVKLRRVVENPFISAIEVTRLLDTVTSQPTLPLPTPFPTPTPGGQPTAPSPQWGSDSILINFGGSAPDPFIPARYDGIVGNYLNYTYAGGGAGISGTNDDMAYDNHIYTFDTSLEYVLTLNAGERYDIMLGWAEIYAPNCVDGARVFGVSLNSRPPIDIDVHALAGGCRTVYWKRFNSVLADPDDGTIVVTLTKKTENPFLSTMALTPRDDEPQTPQPIPGTPRPSPQPTPSPTYPPPTPQPSLRPTPMPDTPQPSPRPTSTQVTPQPSRRPTPQPTPDPSRRPTPRPSPRPTPVPTPGPTRRPTPRPTPTEDTPRPTPTPGPTPSPRPTPRPTSRPTTAPKTPRPTPQRPTPPLPVRRCIMSNGETCPLSEMGKNAATEVETRGQTRCGRNTIGLRQNPYFFKVWPGRSDKLLIFFQGGGLCTSELSCTILQTTENVILEPMSPDEGIFDVRRADNPFADWTLVHIGYCTGDVHTGDSVSGDFHFNGRANVNAVLDWTFRNVPNPSHLFIGGCSAGSIGAQFWTQRILDHYHKSAATAPITSTAYDSGVGNIGQESYEEILASWNSCSSTVFGWTSEQYNQCLNGQLDLTDVQLEVQKNYRDVLFTFVNYKDDYLYYDIFLCGLLDLTDADGCSQRESLRAIENTLRIYTDAASKESNNVLTYWVNHKNHCLLPYDRLYNRRADLVLDAMGELAGRTPETVIKASCSVSPAPSPDIDYGCDPVLKNAVFRGSPSMGKELMPRNNDETQGTDGGIWEGARFLRSRLDKFIH